MSPDGSRPVGLPTIRNAYFTAKHGRPRALMYTSSDLKVWFMPQFSDADTVTCRIRADKTSSDDLIFTSRYSDGLAGDTFPAIVGRAATYCDNHTIPYILGADTNAHSPLWNSPDTNPRGENAEEFILSHDLYIHNIGNAPTFETCRAKSIIDVTLTNATASDSLSEWCVSNFVFDSDHNGITFRVRTVPRPLTYKRNLRAADWERFQSLVKTAVEESTDPPNLWQPDTVDAELERLTSVITTALDKVAPLKASRSKTTVYWWSEDVQTTGREMKDLRRAARRDPTRWPEFNAKRYEYHRLCKRRKHKTWQHHTDGTADFGEMARLAHAIQRLPQNKLGMLRLSDGKYTQTPYETLDALMSEHFPGSEDCTSEFHDAPAWDAPDPVHLTDKAHVTTEYIREAFKSFGAHKAPGLDGLRPIVLQHLPDEILPWFKDLFTACLQLRYSPVKWRRSRTIFLPKPGREDYSNVRAFRPISLTSFMLKTLERLAYWELERKAMPGHPLHQFQHGFRKGFCTETLLSRLVNKIEKAFFDKQMVLVAFLDIRGAFDNVTLAGAKKAMEDHHWPEDIAGWYGHYLHHRVGTAEVNGQTIFRRLHKGTPQGGILSPLLWNLIFDAFLHMYDTGPVKCMAYADDANLATQGIDLDTLVSNINIGLRQAVRWGRRNGLVFDPGKTVVVLFHRAHSPVHLSSNVRMNGNDIPYSDTAKCLGLILHKHLSWRPHIEHKVRTTKRLLHQLRSSLGRLWGPSPRMMRWAYTGMVRPAFTYGALIWARGVTSIDLETKLLQIQRLAAMQMTHLRRSTPTAALEVALNLTPLPRYLTELASKTYIRINEQLDQNWAGVYTTDRTTSYGHVRWAKNEIDRMRIDMADIDVRCHEIRGQNKYTLNRKSFLSKNDFVLPGLNCYTDGSKVENQGAGAGIYITLDRQFAPEDSILAESVGLGADTSVFQAEVHAIDVAATRVRTLIQTNDIMSALDFDKVNIISDSQAALQSLTAMHIKSKVVHNCIQHLNRLAALVPVELHWIKAHAGFRGNETADHLAYDGTRLNQDATRLGLVGERHHIPKPLAHVHDVIETHVRRVWETAWLAITQCRQSKLFLSSIKPRLYQYMVSHDRKELGMLLRFITGHAFTQRHNHTCDPITFPDPTCRVCGGIDLETPIHVIAECDGLAQARHSVFGEHYLDAQGPDWSPHKLLRFLKLPAVRTLEDPDYHLD